MNPFEHNKEDAEKVHRNFFKAHDGLRAAHEQFNAALLIIQKRESYRDTREAIKEYRTLIEKFRDASEALLFDAANFRTKMIGETGCDGHCHE